jgi:hypothetical protein
MRAWKSIVALGVAVGFAAVAAADDGHGHGQRQRVFRAELASYNEVPSLSTPARGQFYALLNQAGTELRYWLSFSDLSADVSQAHIHFGQHHTTGGIIVWLCEGTLQAPTASTPSCGGPRSSSVSGVITAAEVIGPAAGAAYANVHSGSPGPPVVGFPPGEIRGQIH